jgi:hypothetical protein
MMDHNEAAATGATERYMLGEMGEAERSAFEEHFFSCAECAEDVRAAGILRRGIREAGSHYARRRPVEIPVAGSWRNWFTPPVGAAAAAVAVGMTGFASYRVLLSPPASPEVRAFSPVTLHAVTRGEGPGISLRRGEPYVFLLDVNQAKPGESLYYELVAASGSPAASGTAVVPPNSQLALAIRPNELKQTGDWALVLRNLQGSELARYPFRIDPRPAE